MNKPILPEIKKLQPARQRRMDELLEKNSEGTITPTEKARLEELVAEAEQLMVENSRRIAEALSEEGTEAPSGAVPVTVWVQPQPVTR